MTKRDEKAEVERDESGDLILECLDCGTQFAWTSGEQAFYDRRGFARPKRCPPCRDRKRAARQAAEEAK